MRIKEVEALTGLTAKAIRLYESKGLLNVARESENDYRDYSEEDVRRLKTIAFLREMDISLQGIKDWTDGKLTLQDLMHFAAGQADDEQNAQRLRRQTAQEVLRIMEADPQLDLVDALEDIQTLRELKREMEKIGDEIRGNLVVPVVATVAALGPIGWTVINILEGRTKHALISFGLSILALIFIFMKWSNYFRVAKERRMRSGCLPSLLFAVLALGIVIGLICFVAVCQETLFASNGDCLTLFRHPWIHILILMPIAEIYLAHNIRSEGKKEKEEPPLTRKQRLALWGLLIAFNLTLLYGCIVSVSVCDSDGFTRHSFFNPGGKHYSLNDIARVDVGFYGNSIPILSGHQSGDFYYKVTFSDGRTEDWAQGSPTVDDQDSWEALLALDTWLMSAGIDKTASDKNRENFMYDQECLDICDAILNNR